MSRFVVLFLFIFLLLKVCLADERQSTNKFTASVSNWHLLNIKKMKIKASEDWEVGLPKSKLHLVSASTILYTLFYGFLDWNDFPALVKISLGNKLTNYSHKFLDIFIATKTAMPSSLPFFLSFEIVNFGDRQRNLNLVQLNYFEWPIFLLFFILLVSADTWRRNFKLMA